MKKSNKKIKHDVNCYFTLADKNINIISDSMNSNLYSFDEIKTILNSVGIDLKFENDFILNLKIDSKKFNKEITRNAGNRRKYAYPTDASYETYKYYDILYWRYGEGLNWNEIAKKANLSRATCFRHKKEMENSISYKNFIINFNPNHANDYEYYKTYKGLDCSF